ncbi:2-C-methyl-D-erythritol 4-phosphate cytidylyltransferase [Anaerorhabdus furcosa]|uniref:2-C-methyl-D-erythritol 4-phosphate cytidylyltransferase n=1 Tax=Anaerorhabdus furcosa TaxID=118967 RepID=A0A1T4K7J4_9FIRM|nr:2-C-methyl-D-erythritol 4-phosphate cytidylyltransferase [Anaerorhabdus furcosa]SJZ38404.1 2-C-methyl-D-erythritol 4-phosphate cytidylyltransferase [Anaerorhabdus furcosa]
MKYSVIIVAAGRGSRMNLGYNKVYYPLNGITILEQTMKKFENDPLCNQIIVVTEGEDYKTHTNRYSGKIVIVKGGETRQESVYNGLCAAKEEVVFVHDGARPFVTIESLKKLTQAMENNEAALLMVPCKDTIKVVENGVIAKTLDRAKLMHAQTPQAFKTKLLIECYQKAFKDKFLGTDDASLVEKYSDVKIAVVEGDYKNIKITTPEDIE